MSDIVRTPVQANSILLGDCLEILQRFPSCVFSSVVCDPPYGLSAQPDMRDVLRHWLAGDDYEHHSSGFMGKTWDSFVPGPKIWKEVMRVLKPGGHILSFGGTRCYDMMVTAMRLAG
jgi:DNA modification methylase